MLHMEAYLAKQQRWPKTVRHILARYAREWILRIEDVTPMVREEHAKLPDLAALQTPVEAVYPAEGSSLHLG